MSSAEAAQSNPWNAHALKFRVRNAQITAIPEDAPVIVEHGLSLVVEEGRFHSLNVDDDGRDAPSTLRYMCFVNTDGAGETDSWSGIDARIVITGVHENGSPITITGMGFIGKTDKGATELSFEEQPEIVVIDQEGGVSR